MALNSHLVLEGKDRGNVEGSCLIAPHENTIEVWGCSHSVVSPRDAASGLPSGKRQHKPFVITKGVDKASPHLMAILTTNESVVSWALKFYRPSESGAEEHYYTIELENATIASINMEKLNNKYADNMQHEYREHVAFTYQKITWTWEIDGIMCADDWRAPKM
jgi:type VI secretion system secreted protein Hcp